MKNAACVLIIKKNSEIVPKVVYPASNGVPSDKWFMFNEGEYWEGARKGDRGLLINGVWLDPEEIKLKRKYNSPARIKNGGKKV